MNVTDWLRRVGLERYEAVFRENDITLATLLTLTMEDLRELITSVGHRRQLLWAIADLRLDHQYELPVATGRRQSELHHPRPGPERRLISVMFCDLMDFTALSSRLDPEDLSVVIRSYQATVATAVMRCGGFIARYVGDGVLIYFGWPEAHEADAELAVRAAQAVVAHIGQTMTGSEPLKVRIGIATGLVVVGEAIGSGDARQQTAVGETPNLAARLQALAEPNGIVIDATTRRQIGDLFECLDLGRVALKGLVEPVQAWQVLDQSTVLSRFEALHADHIAPLIGRDKELELLLRRWRQAKQGEGQFVLLAGEPGIGKSRLITALEEQLRGEPHRCLRYFCSPHHQDSALHPIIARWERDLRFTRGDTPGEKLYKLEARLASVNISPEDIRLIADLLSVPASDRYPMPELSPQRRKEKTFDALTRSLANIARLRPVLVLFEDLHWADASSLELLNKMLGMLRTLPVLLVVSFRLEFRPPWLELAIATTITLARLTDEQSAQLAERTVVDRDLSPAVIARIVSRSDGVPLFIEELTKAVLENAGTGRPSSDPVEVPATLQSSLIARLDRLPTAKMVAQVGAVIGREFAHALLTSVAQMPDSQLEHGIESLVASGLAFCRGTLPDALYTFKHALVRDAAYSTLLRKQRQALHERIGRAIEELWPETLDTKPELLAHHFTQADIREQAIRYWRLAGLRSVGQSAHAEAGAQFGFALDLLDKLPPGKQRDADELDLRLHLAVSLIAVDGFGAPRVEECALRAAALAEELETGPGQFAARRLAWNSCLMRQPVPKTIRFARHLLDLAQNERSPAKLAVAQRALGYSLFVAGAFGDADEILARGATLADAIPAREFAVYGEHPSMICRIYGAQTRAIRGFLDAGTRLIEEGVAFARREENMHSLAWALGVASHLAQIRHEPDVVSRYAAETIAVTREHHLPQWLGLGERCLGWAMHRAGELEAGIALEQQGANRWRRTGALLHITHCELTLADSYLRDGRTALARGHLHAARAHRDRLGENYLAAEMERLTGVLLLQDDADDASAEDCWARSMAIADRQGASLFKLRTATTFAKVLAERGHRARALDLLAPVYDGFTEGFDTADLAQARRLLNELS